MKGKHPLSYSTPDIRDIRHIQNKQLTEGPISQYQTFQHNFGKELKILGVIL